MEHDLARHPVILVIDESEEVRMGIERLLRPGGYRVVCAKDAAGAARAAEEMNPDLVLLSAGTDKEDPATRANRIRKQASVGHGVPVVVFSVGSLQEGAEVEIEPHLYLTQPDNFDQLRRLFSRLLEWPDTTQ